MEADASHDFDHGCFVPLLLMYPQAAIPVVQLSIHASYDGDLHYHMGELLRPLRSEGVLIVGSGSASHSCHDPQLVPKWHDWLTETVTECSVEEREERLRRYWDEPLCRAAHPSRPDHFMPAIVAAGAAGHSAGFKVHARVAALDLSSFVFSDAPAKAAMAGNCSQQSARSNALPPAPQPAAKNGNEDPCSSAVQWAIARTAQGNIEGIINALDEFAWTRHWMMFVGDRKGAILDAAVRSAAAAATNSRRPLRVLELGTFLGYSALRIAREMLAAAPAGSTLTTVESSTHNAALARSLLQHANLPAGLVTVVEAASSTAIANSRERFDLVFLDHHKDLYLQDARALVAGGCLQPSAVLVADNVVFPGCPGYLEWVRG